MPQAHTENLLLSTGKRSHSRAAVWVALAGVAVATGIRFLCQEILGAAVPFLFYYPAVMLAAWCGGIRPGALATLLSVLAADFFFIEPRFQLTAMSAALWFAMIVFCGSGFFIGFLSELRLKALERETDSLTSARYLKALLEKEKQFVEEVLTSIDDAFFVVDREWRLVYANEPLARLARVDKEQLKGKTIWEAFPHHKLLNKPHLERAMQDRVPVRFETRDERAGVWLSVGVFPCVNGITVYAIDISERKRIEHELAATRARLQEHATTLEHEVAKRTAELSETVAQLESFSYTVSHDLRSPLRAMQAFAHMTLEEEGDRLSETGRNYLQRIDAAAQRMDRLIQDVITFNKVARMEMPLETVNTERIVDEVIHQYPSVKQPHATFEIKRPLDNVLANPPALVQTLANVLANAVKFVYPGEKALVTISTVRHDGKVCVCVEDRGIGIATDSMSKIFDPFHRAHADAGYEGTGIGLAVAKKAVERMGGTFEVTSQLGKGSRFCIELKAP